MRGSNQGPLLSALPVWKEGLGELTALKKFLNLCSSKPAARRSFGVCSTRSLNLQGGRLSVYRETQRVCCDCQLCSPCQPTAPTNLISSPRTLVTELHCVCVHGGKTI